jgi:branched-chain amino acid transport system substrate-binding protein
MKEIISMRILVRLGAFALGLALVAPLGMHRAGAANEPYFVGAVVSESGPGSTLGRPEADSMQMAVDEINKAGGVNGHPLQLKVLDDESNGTTAVNAVRQLLDQHPVAILGSSLTQTTLAMVPLVTQAGVPMISFASNAQVIEPVSERKWIFKMPIADTHVAQLLQAYMKRHNQTKLAAIYRDDDYGKTGLAHFEEVTKNDGFQLVDRDAIAATASDATTQLTHVKAANPQALLVWTTLPSANVIIRGYRELSLSVPIYYSDGAATGVFLKQAGSALNGAYIATTKINVVDQLPPNDPQKKVLAHYASEFVKLYPKDAPVSIFGGFGYDGVYVLKEALQKAGGPGAKLRDAIEHATYTGVSGTYRMSPNDHNGLAIDSLVLTQVENQQFKIVR